MISAIFKNQELQHLFERDGYVVFDFVSAEQAALIAEKYYQLQKEIPRGFSSTASNPDAEFKKAISDHAGQIITESMDAIFQEYKKLGITFLCKAPGADGKVPVHRDWMVVDESKYFSGTIWVPMSDVTDANGALRVWPGSHKFFNHIRSSSVPVAYKNYEDEIWDQMVVVPMKAGQAFLLNHALIHASSPNITDKERLILVCGIIPDKAKLSYYHGTGNGTVEKFDMPDDMFMKHSEIGGRPSVGLKVDEFEYHVEPENRLRVQQLLTSSRLERIAKPLLQQEELQHLLTEKGYFKMPLLSMAEVTAMKNDLKGKSAGVLPVGISEEIARMISSAIKGEIKIIDAKLEIKKRNTNGLEHLGQELTCVENEDEYCSLTCWIPLCDIDIEHGPIGILEGSHLFLDNKRPSPQPLASYTFNGNELDIFPYLETVNLKAGDALIMDDRLFRCSLPVTGTDDVTAICLRLVHAKARLSHYYLNPDEQNSMLKYEVDETFYKKYDNNKLAALYKKGEKITGYNLAETVYYKYPEFTTDELVELIQATGGKPNNTLVKELMKNAVYKKYTLEKGNVFKGKNRNGDVADQSSDTDTFGEKNFWSTYSPLNIVREIKRRVLG